MSADEVSGIAVACTCTNYCPEDDNPCEYCSALDVYDPCPVVGFGCGPGCDCCTPDEQKAAVS